ncbi:MAG TPA: ATP synthase F1 subunit gamma [Gemmatimonadales bacterium]|nr:ATP synthase F1 subunit gamma [Gemmatimonadales bacterium]
MAKTRALRRRIRSIESTRQVTRTMEMVSTSKLKRAQDRVVAARPYATALAETIAELLSPELAERFPLLRRPAPPAKGGPTRAAVLLVTSNRGLAGAFNANLIRAARERVAELEAAGYGVDLLVVGKKAISYFKFVRRPLALARLDIGDRPTAAHAAELAAPLIARFEAGELASLDVVYAHFKSALATPPVVERVLPVEARRAVAQTPSGKAAPPLPEGAGARTPNFILRPGPVELLEALLPLYVRNLVFRALVETAASEHGARRTAMKNATDNAGEILDILRRTYNRARQGQITQELAEIVGGAEALKG